MSCEDCGKLPITSVGMTKGCVCFPNLEGCGNIIQDAAPLVDAARSLLGEVGTRQYEVRLIHTRWTAGKRGAGEEYVYSEQLLDPRPKVSPMTAIAKQNTDAGMIEAGSLTLTEISSQLDESVLLGWIDGRPPGDDTNFYWEIRSPARDCKPDVRRRFYPRSAPVLKETKFGWEISLIRAQGDRVPSGLPRGEPTGVEE